MDKDKLLKENRELKTYLRGAWEHIVILINNNGHREFQDNMKDVENFKLLYGKEIEELLT